MPLTGTPLAPGAGMLDAAAAQTCFPDRIMVPPGTQDTHDPRDTPEDQDTWDTLETPSLLPHLERHFGFTSFRPHQEEIVRDILAGQDVLAILPTGGGKSLCFQLPAVVQAGLAVVVSPLVALMKDQVDSLAARGIPATFLSSTLAWGEVQERLRGAREGRYRLLYVAPERLLMPGFLAALGDMDVRFVAVDEAHCVSQWGHDFRPEYRRVAELRGRFPEVPIVALSATATARVRADIAETLRLREPRRYVASFDRPNLLYRIEAKSGAFQRLLGFVRRYTGQSGIVYARSRKSVDQLADRLRREGVNAAPYHAGLDARRRDRTQEAFLSDRVSVIVATVAFGMGIDKPDVRFVAHHDLPGEIESYYQETGRAGRDGLPAECLLLWSRGDVVLHRRFLDDQPDPAERARASKRLADMVSFADSRACRRRMLLAYFGESRPRTPCGACDNCLSPHHLPPALSPAPVSPTPHHPLPPLAPPPPMSPVAQPPIDEALFETLRKLRKSLAVQRSVPAYVIFSDASLREMASQVPTDTSTFSRVRGVGEKKLADLGPPFIEVIRAHLAAQGPEHPTSGLIARQG